jgi:hypothetical protein
MARSFPSCAHAASPVAICVAPSVSSWQESSNRHRPLAEATVLELSRRIQRW